MQNSSTNVEVYSNTNNNVDDNKATTNNTPNNFNEQIKNANLYLQKHKLDVVLLPNKKVKLSDLSSSLAAAAAAASVNQQQEQQQTQSQIIIKNKSSCNEEELVEEYDGDEDDDDDVDDDFDEEDDYYEEDDIESDDFIDDEDDDDDESKIIDKFISDNCKIEQQQSFSNDNNNDIESINHHHHHHQQRDLEQLKRLSKIKRKKREPSLKLIQKLTIDDLQLIVNCIQNSNALVLIADVTKANYIDKILKVQLLNDFQLSNGSREALLKKSMFPKEISLLFDSFIKSLCTERIFYENASIFFFIIILFHFFKYFLF